MDEALIRTTRLILRPLGPNDAEALYQYRTEPTVAAMQGWSPASVGEVADFIERLQMRDFPHRGEWSQVGIFARSRSEIIGDVGVWVSEAGDVAEIGYTIAPACQRRGYGAEAVAAVMDYLAETHGLRRFLARTLARNAASIALLTHLGFREERREGVDVTFVRDWVPSAR